MIQEGSREVILRTLASDTKALANQSSLDNERKVIRLSGSSAQPTVVEQAVPSEPGQKKQSPLLIALVAIIAIGALGFAGYLLYSNLKTGGQTVQTL